MLAEEILTQRPKKTRLFSNFSRGKLLRCSHTPHCQSEALRKQGIVMGHDSLTIY